MEANEIANMIAVSAGRGMQEARQAYFILDNAESLYGVGWCHVRLDRPDNPEYTKCIIPGNRRNGLVDGLGIEVKIGRGGDWYISDFDAEVTHRQLAGYPIPQTLEPHTHEDTPNGGQLDAGIVFAAGAVPTQFGGTGIDGSLTGGANTFAKQKTLGGAFVIEAIESADIATALTTPPAIGGTTPAAGMFSDLAVSASAELTIASGAVTRTQTFHRIDTEADASSDDLDTINGGAAGDTMIIRAENAARTVSVTTAGNILTPDGGSVTLDETHKLIVLVYDGTLSKWIVMWGAGSGSVPDASIVPYTPAVSGDYDTTPAFVAPALDELAARVELLEGGGGGAISGIMPSQCDLRLTLESGVAISTTDQSGATSAYLTPYRGNIIALYDGSAWLGYPTSQLSLSLSGFDRHRLYDIFCYDNAGTPTLEAEAWNAPTTGAISGCTNANPPVVTSTGHPLAVDDVVTIYGVAGSTGINGTFRVSAIATNTFTLQTLAGANPGAPGAYSSGGTWVKKYSATTRATALTTQSGVLVKNGDATRRYVGTLAINASGGASDDTVGARLLDSHVGQKPRHLRAIDTADNWTYAVSAWRAANNSLLNRADFVIGVAEQRLDARVSASIVGNSVNAAVGVAIDAVSSNSAQVFTQAATVTNVAGTATAHYLGFPTVGLHYAQWVEYRVGGTVTFLGDNGGLQQSGMQVIIGD